MHVPTLRLGGVRVLRPRPAQSASRSVWTWPSKREMYLHGKMYEPTLLGKRVVTLYPSSCSQPTSAHMTNLAASSYSPAVIDPRRFLSSSIPAFRQMEGPKPRRRGERSASSRRIQSTSMNTAMGNPARDTPSALSTSTTGPRERVHWVLVRGRFGYLNVSVFAAKS